MGHTISILGMISAVGRHGPALLLCAVLAGLAFPWLADAARPALPLGVLVANIGLFMQVRPDDLALEARPIGRLAAMLAWTLLGTPLAVWSVLQIVRLPAEQEAGLLLYSMAPTAASAAAVAAMLGLCAPLMLLLRIAGCLYAPLLLPALATITLPTEMRIDPLAMAGQLALLVMSAGGIAALVCKAGPVRRYHAQVNTGIAVLGMIIVGLAMMQGMQAMWLTHTAEMAQALGIACMTVGGLQALSTLAFAHCGRLRALTLGLAGGYRNVSLVAVALVPQPAADSRVACFFAMSVFACFALTWLTDVGLRCTHGVAAVRMKVAALQTREGG